MKTINGLTALALILLALAIGPGTARATGGGQPLEAVVWAPTSGPDALWYDALGGLKTAAALFNAHGGIGGRPLSVAEVLISEDDPDFFGRLAPLLERPNVVAAVGGPVHFRAAETAEFMSRMNRPWLGPWSNEKELYQGGAGDPFAVLPPWNLEMPALLGFIKEAFEAEPARSGPVFLVFYNFPRQQEMAARTREMAAGLGLDLKRAPINPDFSDWDYLSRHIQGAQAVIVWLSQGGSAAFLKAAKSRHPEAIYLTNSVNATNRNLVVLSGGAWNGVVFPAVLKPSSEIPPAYDAVVRKYGPVGLDGGYQTYLGFAQGQILARALSLASGRDSRNLTRNLYDMKGFPTLLAAEVDYAPSRHVNPGSFYLGQARGNGHWERAALPPPLKKEP